MSYDNNSCTFNSKNNSLDKTVNIPVSLYESIKGRYFVGQTGDLMVDSCSVAWASLVNPRCSDVDLYANVFTVSNFSKEYLTAEIWLNTRIPKNSFISDNVSPTNTALNHLPKNKVEIRYIKSTNLTPESGVNVYQRIVPPMTTLVGEEDGKFIEKPNGNYTLIIKSLNGNSSKVIVAFGWWEKPIC